MPIEVQLSVPAGGKAVEHLQLCIGLQAALADAKVRGEFLLVDAKAVLLLEDVYGRGQAQAASDESLWRTEGTRNVLHEADLRDPEKEGYVGKWNLDFLRWLQGVSAQTSEPVAIAYEHERGDTLYELAWWTSDPLSQGGEIETFGIQSNDGMDKPQWRAEVVRHSDSRVELR